MRLRVLLLSLLSCLLLGNEYDVPLNRVASAAGGMTQLYFATFDLSTTGSCLADEPTNETGATNHDCDCTTAGICDIGTGETYYAQGASSGAATIQARSVFASTSSGLIYVRMDIEFNVSNATFQSPMFRFMNGASGKGGYFRATNGGGPHIQALSHSGAAGGTLVLSEDVHYCFEFVYDIDLDDSALNVGTPASETTACAPADFDAASLHSNANGTGASGAVDGFQFQNDSAANDVSVDNICFSTTAFGPSDTCV